MSRLFESSLTGKISNILVEEENKEKAKFCPRCGGKMSAYPAVSRYDNETEICSDCGTSEAMLNYTGAKVADPHRYDTKTGKKLNESDSRFIDSLDRIADFMIDYDKYGFEDNYEGDEDQKRDQLIQDIARDKTTVKAYLYDVVTEQTTEDPKQVEEAKSILKDVFDVDVKDEDIVKESDEVTPEDLEKDDKAIERKSRKEVEDRIAELKLTIEDGVSDEEKAEMEKEIADLENKLNECGNARGKLLTEAWNGRIKSGAALRELLGSMDEDASPEECQKVLDALKTCCEEAKTLTDDEYYQNGFQSVIDDIEMIYDDEDLSASNVDWELDGFYDWCDGANLWVELTEAHKLEVPEGHLSEFVFDPEDAEYFQKLVGPGIKVELESRGETENSYLVFSLENKWISGFNSSTKELDAEIDKYFSEKYPEMEIHRNNVGTTLWLSEKSKKNESAKPLKESGVDGTSLSRIKELAEYLNFFIKYMEEHNVENVHLDGSHLAGDCLTVAGEGYLPLTEDFSETYYDDSIMSEYINEGAKPKKLTEDSYEKGIFKDIEDALVDAGFSVDRYIDVGVLTKNIGWEVSKDGKHTQLDCPGSWYDEDEDDEDYDESAKPRKLKESDEKRYYILRDLQKCFDELDSIDYGDQEGTERYGKREPGIEEQNKVNEKIKEIVQKNNITKKEFSEVFEPYSSGLDLSYEDYAYEPKHATEEDKEKLMSESVTVVTADGSSVNTQDAASVSTDAGCTTVVTDNTTVTICNDAPVENELLPTEGEIVPDEPVEDIPAEEVPEEPIEDELTEADEDQDSVISVKSLSVVKNQGNVFMLTYKDSNDNEQYVVCEDFNNETNEGNEAETYSNKDDADKDYFARLDVNTEE